MDGGWGASLLMALSLRHAEPVTTADSVTAGEPVAETRPEDAGGVAIAEGQGAKRLLWIPRAVLFVPRHALDFVFHPVRLSLMVWERGHFGGWYYRLFWNEKRTVGIDPAIAFESGFGLGGGARFVHADLFGRRERLSVRATYGPRSGHHHALSLSSGGRLRQISLTWESRFRSRSADRFYGIGSRALSTSDLRQTPVDPRSAAFDTRFLSQRVDVGPSVSWSLTPLLTLRSDHRWQWRRLADPTAGDDVPLSAVYDTSELSGWKHGSWSTYSEVSLGWDTTRSRYHVSAAVPSEGSRVRGFFGLSRPITGDPSEYTRVGLDAQAFLNLFRGDRVLRLRLLVDTVNGDFERIPVTDLPSLGGPVLLRGYPRGRFRDRIAAMTAAEYVWPIYREFSGFAFVDSGSVWSRLNAIDFRDLKAAFGGGIELHTMSSFLLRLQLSGTPDGSFQMYFVFTPASEPHDLF